MGRSIFWRHLRKRVGSAVALLAYLAASFGLPIPAPAARRDRSVPYPCMDNPCGCSCAEDCWRHCCCTTPEERWAWAAAHDVTPPDYAERPGAPAESPAPCPHCHPQAAGKSGASGALGTTTASPLRCKGLSTLWVTLGTTPVPSSFAWRPAFLLADHLMDADQFPSLRPQAPIPPPPR
ncbi:MAG TPA: hypothetical protein VMS17_18510 [Gemmataceae bacterium]|nr:hypothetical protein [Gemmataceae bacterium]